jgi:hypothetical protein
MGHHVGDRAANVQWAQLCNDLIHRVCTLFPQGEDIRAQRAQGLSSHRSAHRCGGIGAPGDEHVAVAAV